MKQSQQLSVYDRTAKSCTASTVPSVAPYKALENFFKALYETTRGTCSAQFFRPVIKKCLSLKSGNHYLLCHFWLVHVNKLINLTIIYIFVGDMFELGVENGRFYSLNVPLRDGIDDQGRLGEFL